MSVALLVFQTCGSTSRRSQPPLALSVYREVAGWRISRVGGGSAFYVRGCTMPTPGYYKTSTRAATVREMARMRGVLMVPLTFILMKFVMRPSGGVWMPSLCAETDCRAEDLSPQFWRATDSQRAAFERLGFAPCFYSKLRRNLNPMYLDNGAITYLHSGQSYVGTLVYGRLQVPAPLNQVRETVVVGFTATFETVS